jgi:hypothetical protein
VPVQSAGDHAQAGSETAHAQGVDAVGGNDGEGLGDDPLAGQCAAAALIASGGLNLSERGPAPAAACGRFAMVASGALSLTVNTVHDRVNIVTR